MKENKPEDQRQHLKEEPHKKKVVHIAQEATHTKNRKQLNYQAIRKIFQNFGTFWLQTFAIAKTTFRAISRSKLLHLLLLIEALLVLIIPAVIRDDGTIAGKIKLYLSYTCSALLPIITIAPLWMGTNLMAKEMETKIIRMVAVKGISPIKIWLGKWFGIMLANIIIISFGAVLIYLQLSVIIKQESKTPQQKVIIEEDILAPQTSIKPMSITQSKIKNSTDQQSAQKNISLQPGEYMECTFRLPDWLQLNNKVFLKFCFLTADPSFIEQMPLQWIMGSQSDAKLNYRVARSFTPNEYHRFALMENKAGSIVYASLQLPENSPISIIFPAEKGIELYIIRSNFLSHFSKVFCLILAKSAFITALALMLGSAFSSPVALLTAFAFFVIINMNENLKDMAELTYKEGFEKTKNLISPEEEYHHDHNEEHIASYKLSKPSLILHETLWALLHPLVAFDPVEHLTKSTYIENAYLARYFGMMLGIYSTATGLCAIFILRKRQLGLIQEE